MTSLPASEVLTDVTFGNTIAGMPVITLKVSPEIAARLAQLAIRRRMSKSAVVREALEEKLREPSTEPSLYDLMKSSIGVVDSGVTDLGHNPKHMAGFGRR
jgi:hypothetical protein